ncbi:DNA replication complex GINS protein PSF3 [Chamberlinius hualienensis]
MANIDGNYFSVEDILATQARVPCKFEIEVLRLGYLDPSCAENIPKGAKQDLPFWLARSLCNRNNKIVSVELPTTYKKSSRDILNADATVVDLHKLGPYFYELALHLLEFSFLESKDLGDCVVEVFKRRFRMIMDASQNTLDRSRTQLISNLDDLEKTLFNDAQNCLIDFHNWQMCQGHKITTSTLVSKHRKRKRDEVDDS